MNRSFSTDALVLSSRIIGEDNRIITFLSPERGVFDAILYGGRKSKLRSMVSQFHSGKGWFYNDESRHSVKITDFEPSAFRPSIRENLYKTCAASFAAELVIKSFGVTDQSELSELWILVNGFLDGLDLSSDEDARLGTLRFIWRYLNLLGMCPDAGECAVCGRQFFSQDVDFLTKSDENMISYYDAVQHGFLCSDCASDTQEPIILSAEGIRYLASLSRLPPAEVRKLPVHAGTYQKLHDFLFELIRTETGIKFRTLEAGNGIL